MNGTLTGARTTARVAPTLHDDLVMPPATGYSSGSPFTETTDTPAPQDLFATAPIKALWLQFDWQREEEAYTSFEAAISNRVLALKGRHIGMKVGVRVGTETSENTTSAMDRLASKAVATWHKQCSAQVWQRGWLLVGAALMLLLAGFDLMGLLVLNVR